MRKSKYGKNLRFQWEGNPLPLEKVVLIPTHSTLEINSESKRKLQEAWTEELKKDPSFEERNGKKWRTEFVHHDKKSDQVLIYVSPTDYFTHSILRKESGQIMQFYPNPITINTIQETQDGFILLGIRNTKFSDQANLAFVGAGFVERDDNQETVAERTSKECDEETDYNAIEGWKKDSYNIREAEVICIATGSNTDTTVVAHLPIYREAMECSPGNKEYNEFVYLPNNYEEINLFLDKGGYSISPNTKCRIREISGKIISPREHEFFSSGKVMPAADHLLGGLEAYLNCKKKGLIKSSYQH